MKIHEALRALREEHGKEPGFYKVLSTRTGISYNKVRHLSTGAQGASMKDIIAIRSAYNLPDAWPDAFMVRETREKVLLHKKTLSALIDGLASPDLSPELRAQMRDALKAELGLEE